MREKRKVLACTIGIAISSSLLIQSSNIKAASYDSLVNIDNGMFLDGFNKNLKQYNQYPDFLMVDETAKVKQSIITRLKKNDLDAARYEISQALILNPKDPMLYTLFGVLEAREKKFDAAKQQYKKAVELNKNYTEAYLGLAELAIYEKQFGQAKGYYKQLIRINKKNYGAYIVLANIFFKEGKTHKAINILLDGYGKVKGNIRAEVKLLVALGGMYGVEKTPDKFLALAKDLVKRFPSESVALSILADAYLLNNNKQAAETTIFKVLEVDPKNINQRIKLIKLLGSQTGKEKQTIKQLDKLIMLNPEKLQLLSLKIEYLVRIKEYDAALIEAIAVVKKFPKRELGVHLVGDVYRAKKDIKQALSFYQQAYDLKPKNNTLFLIVDMLTKQNKQDEAIKLLEGKLKNQANVFGIRIYLANLYLGKLDFDKAQFHFEKVLIQKPENIIALNNLALLYSKKGDAAKALPLAKKAYKLAPKNKDIIDTYRSILLRNGSKEEANLILNK